MSSIRNPERDCPHCRSSRSRSAPPPIRFRIGPPSPDRAAGRRRWRRQLAGCATTTRCAQPPPLSRIQTAGPPPRLVLPRCENCHCGRGRCGGVGRAGEPRDRAGRAGRPRRTDGGSRCDRGPACTAIGDEARRSEADRRGEPGSTVPATPTGTGLSTAVQPGMEWNGMEWTVLASGARSLLAALLDVAVQQDSSFDVVAVGRPDCPRR